MDIGGTKCAVVLGAMDGDRIQVVDKMRMPTPHSPSETLAAMCAALDQLVGRHGVSCLEGIGVSCGGPLNVKTGEILGAPNLPGWDRVDVIRPIAEYFTAPVNLENDANAGALAEWHWGAGQGARNLVFLTFGTGMGAGLILDGRLYHGTNDLAGEVGHIRLKDDGPEGFGKPGSFEGFCSGGGIARLARTMAQAQIDRGHPPQFCPTLGDLPQVTAELVGTAANNGDPTALFVFQEVSRQLGRGLAILIDMLNPERIIIGSIYGRQQHLLETLMWEELRQEAIAPSLAVCQVLPSGLGEQVGDYASLAVAYMDLEGAKVNKGRLF